MLASRVLRAADRLWRAYAVTLTRKVLPEEETNGRKKGAEATGAPIPAFAVPAGRRRTPRARAQ